MTWGLILALAVTAYGFKVLGLVVIGERTLPPALDRCLALIPPAMVAAIIVSETFGFGRSLQADERAVGVAAAAVAAWRRAPLVVVIVVGAGVTALIRWVM